jgi:membrane-associated phospholipid phosphatase
MCKRKFNLWFLIPALGSIAVGAIWSIYLPYGEELFIMNHWRIAPWNDLMRYATLLGEWPTWVLAILLLAWQNKKLSIAIALGSFVLLGLNYSLKELVEKDRPARWLNSQSQREIVFVPNEYVNSAQTSFPSGHTASAFAAFFILSQIAARYKLNHLGAIAAIFAVIVALSRVFLVQHFLTDVIAGACIGLSFGLICWHLGCKWANSSSQSISESLS